MSIRLRQKKTVPPLRYHNHAVVNTAAIWNDKTVDTDNRIAWFEARQFGHFPVLVSEEMALSPAMPPTATGVADGFRHTVEHLRFMSIRNIRAKGSATPCSAH